MNIKIQPGETGLLSNTTLRVRIGDACCTLNCRDPEVYNYLSGLYSSFLSDSPAAISMELDIIEKFDQQEISSAESRWTVLRWGPVIAGIYRLSENEAGGPLCTVSVAVEKYLFDPSLGCKIKNLLIPMVYYTVRDRDRNALPAMLVHSCGILRHGKLLLFAAPSEMGKTTVARLCGDEHGQVVNDEMLLLSAGEENAAPTGQGVPIIGGVDRRTNATAPLACVLMLKQSERTSLRRLDRLEAYLRFMRQVIAPRAFNGGSDDTKEMLAETTAFSDRVTKAVPFYELEFTPESGPLWEAIAGLEKTLAGGELSR